MNNLLIRKLLVSIVLAAIAPAILGYLLQTVIASDLQTILGNNTSTAYILAAVVFAVVAFISAQAVPARRRRNRSSGTVVESDVEDGRERGMVKWFNVKKGFGFITWDDGEDVFVHFRSIRGQGHRSLTEGQRVKFNVVRGQKGPQAEDVSVVRS